MFINRKSFYVNQFGDTIVEVMVVLAVLGMAIGISYATANRSLLNARQAQENSQATNSAQSQVEQLISIGCVSGDPSCATNNPLINYLATQPLGSKPSFCIVAGQIQDNPIASPNPNCATQAPLPGSQVTITCLDGTCTAQPRVFEVKVSWDDVLGQGQDTVTQDYTLPQ